MHSWSVLRNLLSRGLSRGVLGHILLLLSIRVVEVVKDDGLILVVVFEEANLGSAESLEFDGNCLAIDLGNSNRHHDCILRVRLLIHADFLKLHLVLALVLGHILNSFVLQTLQKFLLNHVWIV